MSTAGDGGSPGGRRLGSLLRELPPRRAPRSLESRVLREIERRAGRPWWLRGFAQWPGAARAAFAGVAVLAVAVTVAGGNWASDGFGVLRGSGALQARSPHTLLAIAAAAHQLWNVLAGLPPPAWARAALAAAIALYVSLFALGAAAYRWLYVGSGVRPLRDFRPLGVSRS